MGPKVMSGSYDGFFVHDGLLNRSACSARRRKLDEFVALLTKPFARTVCCVPTRPVAQFIDSFRERGQRDGMKRENYLPINICGWKICHQNHHLEKAPCAARPERDMARTEI